MQLKHIALIVAPVLGFKITDICLSLITFNFMPTFLIKNLRIIRFNVINNKHISVVIKPDIGASIKAICFNCLNLEIGNYLLSYKKKINIIAQIHENIWNNKKTIQLNIKDLIL